MIRLLPLALACALPACTTVAVPSAPSVVADTTILDEQGLLAAELAYKAVRLAAETAVDAGALKGAAATRFAALDAKAYRSLQVARQAYAIGNAPSYAEALSGARSAMADVLTIIGKGA